ncbi:3'-5' exonuclease [Pararhizobium sp. BT-229]|uniref:3'-5' exonuclease n=1 Tax=Pararhizobium sp. BT-229 TaxID=2986923 RepID=UPI0035580D21
MYAITPLQGRGTSTCRSISGWQRPFTFGARYGCRTITNFRSMAACEPVYGLIEAATRAAAGQFSVNPATLEDGSDIGTALSAFSADRAVRVMSIHKSKGLEFDTVYILGVEAQTFWGDPADERSAFFVAVSRAKERLILTMASVRERPDNWPRYRWDTDRTAHVEFLEYALQYQ